MRPCFFSNQYHSFYSGFLTTPQLPLSSNYPQLTGVPDQRGLSRGEVSGSGQFPLGPRMSSGFSVVERSLPVHSFPTESSAPLRVVCFGGGTGLSTLLRGLKHHVARGSKTGAAEIENLTAVVSVMDNGGSSGRLRSDFGILPPGDIRNCLVALADDEALLARLFDYRFREGDGVAGHSLGNLVIAALTGMTRSFAQAVKLSSMMLATRGWVLPATSTPAHLCAELDDGTRVIGESAIGSAPAPIRRLSLVPETCDPLPETLDAIANADLITLGPGSLFTSLVPHLLVRGVAEAIAASPAVKVFVCNMMTQPNESLELTAAGHLRAVLEHSPLPVFDAVVVNASPMSPEMLSRYAETGAMPVTCDYAELAALGVRVVQGDFVGDQLVARHDPHHLAAQLLRIAVEHRAVRSALPAAA